MPGTWEEWVGAGSLALLALAILLKIMRMPSKAEGSTRSTEPSSPLPEPDDDMERGDASWCIDPDMGHR